MDEKQLQNALIIFRNQIPQKINKKHHRVVDGVKHAVAASVSDGSAHQSR